MPLRLKKISTVLFLFGLLSGISFYQSCKRSRQCLLVNAVQPVAYDRQQNRVLLPGDSTNAANFSLRILLKTLEFSCQKTSEPGFINTANANSTTADYLYYDTLISIRISCLQDFDSTHLAGSSLNDYFMAEQGFASGSGLQQSYGYNLFRAPDSIREFEFRVSAEFVHGSIFDTILPPVKIK